MFALMESAPVSLCEEVQGGAGNGHQDMSLPRLTQLYDCFNASLARSFKRRIPQCQDCIDRRETLLPNRLLFDRLRDEGAQRQPECFDLLKQFGRPGDGRSCSRNSALVWGVLASLFPPPGQGLWRGKRIVLLPPIKRLGIDQV
jgi:hypothetical protein